MIFLKLIENVHFWELYYFRYYALLYRYSYLNRSIQVYRKSGNFGHGFILASKYEVPKLNTPKYVTLQKLTPKLNTALISFYIYIPLSVPFCLTSFLRKTLSITVIHVYTHTSQTGKCSRCEIVCLDDKREITGK